MIKNDLYTEKKRTRKTVLAEPMRKNIIPIFVVDLFEHAYLQHYGTDKNAYLQAIWRLLNWDQIQRRVTEHSEDYANFKNWQ